MAHIKFERDHPMIYVEEQEMYGTSAQEVAKAFNDQFVGMKNTPETQALMKHHLDEMMVASARSFGRPAQMLMPESATKKYVDLEANRLQENRLYSEVSDLKKELRASNEKINTLEREIEYYKMLTEEN